MQGIVKKGPRLQFRQAEEKDLDYILEDGKFVIPWEREVHSQTLNTEGAIHLVIERIDTLEPVGFLMIAGLNNPSKEIEWTRIILDKKGEGYGHETLKLLKSWAFDDLEFHRARLDCKDYNARALHVYESEGLVREGLIRETILTDGVYENLVILGILDREYFARKERGEEL